MLQSSEREVFCELPTTNGDDGRQCTGYMRAKEVFNVRTRCAPFGALTLFLGCILCIPGVLPKSASTQCIPSVRGLHVCCKSAKPRTADVCTNALTTRVERDQVPTSCRLARQVYHSVNMIIKDSQSPASRAHERKGERRSRENMIAGVVAYIATFDYDTVQLELPLPSQ